jgi:hypothetical protein
VKCGFKKSEVFNKTQIACQPASVPIHHNSGDSLANVSSGSRKKYSSPTQAQTPVNLFLENAETIASGTALPIKPANAGMKFDAFIGRISPVSEECIDVHLDGDSCITTLKPGIS